MSILDGDLTMYLPRDLQIPQSELAIYALGRHRRLVREMLERAGATQEDASREDNDLLDRALCQRGDDIDLELVRRTPTTQEEREIVIGALERVKDEPDLSMAAVARMEDDLRAA